LNFLASRESTSSLFTCATYSSLPGMSLRRPYPFKKHRPQKRCCMDSMAVWIEERKNTITLRIPGGGAVYSSTPSPPPRPVVSPPLMLIKLLHSSSRNCSVQLSRPPPPPGYKTTPCCACCQSAIDIDRVRILTSLAPVSTLIADHQRFSVSLSFCNPVTMFLNLSGCPPARLGSSRRFAPPNLIGFYVLLAQTSPIWFRFDWIMRAGGGS
jgi:hypothetical protein